MAKKKPTTKAGDSSFNNLFLLNKTEKKKVFNIMVKKKIKYLLFYTDYRNLENIFNYGIRPLKDVKLVKDEVYYVWSYLQHDESIDLEFDLSTRAYFWKWAASSGLNFDNMCVLAIDPIKLIEQTVNDWFYDNSLKLVSIHERIPSESFAWIMVRKEGIINKIENLVAEKKMAISVYYGFGSEIKRTQKVAG